MRCNADTQNFVQHILLSFTSDVVLTTSKPRMFWCRIVQVIQHGPMFNRVLCLSQFCHIYMKSNKTVIPLNNNSDGQCLLDIKSQLPKTNVF